MDDIIVGALIGSVFTFLAVGLISFCLGDGDRALDKGNLGDVRQRIIYQHVLAREVSTGVGTGVGTNGSISTVVTTSSHVSEKQEVWITEEYKYNKWVIIKTELK